MITLSQLLKHYKREDIQNEIIENAKDREIAIKFGDKGFGKRPDILKYPKDILELAKQGATSFHASEELWKSPLQLDPMMKKKDAEDLRMGWDLVLDIDSIDFDLSKTITDLIIKALKKHGIRSISCKFSGNKGFHIGVPFESFPSTINGIEMNLLFPDAPRKIARYLIYYIDSEDTGLEFTKILMEKTEKEDVITKLGKTISEVTKKVCKSCNKIIPDKEVVYDYGCYKCGYVEKSKLPLVNPQCKKCNSVMKRLDRVGAVTRTKDFAEHKKKETCPYCHSYDIYSHIDPSCFIDVDTLLISSRHLYRMPYSFNEKSGLISVPIDPDKVLEFTKEMAMPENLRVPQYRFLDKKNVIPNEAKQLLVQSFEFNYKQETNPTKKDGKEYLIPEEAVPEQFFPPCIQQILKGITDGRKRSLFILSNFLASVGWGYDQIEKRLDEWNKKNTEPLREVLIQGQVRYHKQRNKKILPPNCDNKMYYNDLRFCIPDNLCQKIKNPVNYARIKTRYLNKEKKPKKQESKEANKYSNKEEETK